MNYKGYTITISSEVSLRHVCQTTYLIRRIDHARPVFAGLVVSALLATVDVEHQARRVARRWIDNQGDDR